MSSEDQHTSYDAVGSESDHYKVVKLSNVGGQDHKNLVRSATQENWLVKIQIATSGLQRSFTTIEELKEEIHSARTVYYEAEEYVDKLAKSHDEVAELLRKRKMEVFPQVPGVM